MGLLAPTCVLMIPFCFCLDFSSDDSQQRNGSDQWRHCANSSRLSHQSTTVFFGNGFVFSFPLVSLFRISLWSGLLTRIYVLIPRCSVLSFLTNSQRRYFHFFHYRLVPSGQGAATSYAAPCRHFDYEGHDTSTICPSSRIVCLASNYGCGQFSWRIENYTTCLCSTTLI